jgi:hypothetical protein
MGRSPPWWILPLSTFAVITVFIMLEPRDWFVYPTSDGREAVTRNEAARLAAELPSRGIDVPVRVYARKDDTHWAVGVGDPVPRARAQEILTQLYGAGHKQASRRASALWTVIPK